MKLPRVLPAANMIIPVLVLVAAGLFIYNNSATAQKVLGSRKAA